MKYENTINTVWTDGGNVSNMGYFDGTGRFNDLLLCMFGGHDPSGTLPFTSSVMDSIPYNTKVKITVIIEATE